MKEKAIIFDFGNVIINIDVDLTYKAFADLCFKSPERVKQIFQANEIFKKYETGLFSEYEFYEVIRQSLGYPLNDFEIKNAWNALLLDVPPHRIEYLERLRLKYPIYLLSNTNYIHIQKCKEYFYKHFGMNNFLNLFQKAFLSYELALFKPDYHIYNAVLEEIGLKPEEVMFIDDNEENINSASDLGIKTIKINPPECFTTILSKLIADV